MTNTIKRSHPLLSVVAPIYNEEKVIAAFYQRISEVLKGMKIDYELIFVNDGSKDGSEMLLVQLAAQDKFVKIVNFSRNFGHQVAVSAGLQYAGGDAVVIIDSDLQDPPEVIPQLYQSWLEGNEVINAKRRSRQDNFVKKLTAKMFYRFLNMFLSSPIPEDVGDFRLLDHRAVAVLNQLHEKDRYLRGLTSWIGFRQTFVMYDRDKRLAGKTHYPFKKMLKLATDAVFSFSSFPLKIANIAAGLCLLIGLIIVCYVLYSVMYLETVPGWASEIIALVLFSTIQLFVLGIVSEYIGRIYSQVQNRPLYIVSSTINFDKNPKFEITSSE